MNLFAKGHELNPLTKEEKIKRNKQDRRPVWKIWDELAEKHELYCMTDDELEILKSSLRRSDDLFQPVAREIRNRAVARDTRSINEQYGDKDSYLR